MAQGAAAKNFWCKKKFKDRNPVENISVKISLKNMPENFYTFSEFFVDLILRISRLFAKYLCNSVDRFRENKIFPK